MSSCGCEAVFCNGYKMPAGTITAYSQPMKKYTD